MDHQLLDRVIQYKGRAFTVRQDRLKFPNGAETRLDIIEHVGSVVIVPVDSNGNILFVRQYRHAAGLDLLELPAGTLEEGEDIEVCARRELREETGMAANHIERLAGFYLAPGYSTEFMHVFFASDLQFDPLPADPDEFLSVEIIPIATVLAMCAAGQMPDAKSLAAILLAKSKLGWN